MGQHDDITNRRRSLSISALLNEDTVDPLAKRKSTSSEDRSSSTSPVMSIKDNATMTSNTSESHNAKGKRRRISPHQYNRLMETFDQTDTPSSEMRENLANELDMTKRGVQVWFQNRRAKVNRSRNQAISRNRQASLIPPQVMRSRRISMSDPYDRGLHPIVPPPQQQQQQQQQQYQRQHQEFNGINIVHRIPPPREPSRFDILASAAEYLTKDTN